MLTVKGRACKGILTKLLVQEMDKKSIAVLKHRAIDLVAAQDLKRRKVKAIINCDKTIDNEHVLDGAKYLLDNNIGIYDVYDKEFFTLIHNGDYICIDNNKVYVNNTFLTYCSRVDKELVADQSVTRHISNKDVKYRFIKNTMSFMEKEMDYFLSDNELPPININLKGREVVIITRGRGYRDDLKAIKSFIINKKPVLISVDGGADAVAEINLTSDIIIGDMDSVSNRSLMNCKQIVVHSYCNGYAPGLRRVDSLGLDYELLRLKGTSEDAALYLAKLKGASTIYMIGGHTGIDEFIEKGRAGMGSTVLLRMIFGTNIIDLKGISTIVRQNSRLGIRASIVLLLIAFIIFAFLTGRNPIHVDLKALFNVR